MKTDILIKNGTIVNADKTFKADILISDGKILKISKNIILESYNPQQIIDASEKYIFPGFIDPHVHLNLPTPAGFSSDDFNNGTKAALYGGTTTIIDFVTPNKGETLTAALKKRRKEAEKANCNYALHVSPIDFDENTEAEIKVCIEQGVKSFKVYMAYKSSIGLDDDELLKVMKVIAKYDSLLLVHAEDGDAIDKLQKKFIKENKTTPEYHPKSRPAHTESDAVKKVIAMAKETGCSLYIVHVSAQESLKYIRRAKSEGQKIYAETCPHYLLLNDKKYIGDFTQASKFVLSPPLRKPGNEQTLWEALKDGTFDTIGTDHCPFTSEQKTMGINNFTKIPNGAGGIEYRPALLYTYGFFRAQISLNRFTELMSTKAAQIFGMFPKKGIIKEGSDADIVVWNANISSKNISAETSVQNTDLNIYDEFGVMGNAEIVILNGEIVITNF